jgi:two-component system sporulation sensor kinase C
LYSTPSSDPSKASRDALREGAPGDEPFRSVANCTYDWESWHALDGRLMWVNSAVERFTGYSPAECLKLDDYPLPMTAPADRSRIAEALEDAKRGNSSNDLEFKVVHRDGTSRWMAVSWQPMYSEKGEHLGFRTSVRDVTQRRELREALRLHAEHLEQLVQERTSRVQQLERHRRQMEKAAALGQLAAGIAHEVNNPLAGIRNAFELIKRSIGPEHEHFELLELIDREIERIGSITHQIYGLYRREPQPPIELDLNRIVAEVTSLLQSVARKRGVRLEATPSPTPATAQLPEGEVKQILYNLIRNAIDASPSGESVEVQVERDVDEARIHVADSGAGISESELPSIFDPFFTTKAGKADSGMGLGLPVSRSLIEAMGGAIEVRTSDGAGSCFTASFPLGETATIDA